MSESCVAPEELLQFFASQEVLKPGDVKELRKRFKTRKVIDAIKQKHRSSLKLEQWRRYGFFASFDSWLRPTATFVESLAIKTPSHQSQIPPGVAVYTIERVSAANLSVSAFIQNYEEQYQPVVMSGVSQSWPASSKWTFESLKNDSYRNCRLKCGEDDDGYSVKVPLKTFLRYVRYNMDDSPLYVFDSSFDDNKDSKGMLHDFEVPIYFRDDLFRLVGERRRPPYRWFLVGPKRSGTSLHVDPLGTSAWNTVIVGRKLWVLFPPGLPKSLVTGADLKETGEDGEAITYFTRILPRIREEERRKERTGQPGIGMVEFIQYEGETVFIPGGWWHAVLNLSDTVAVTQNFCSRTNFERVWRKTRVSRKHMAKRWLDQLLVHYPELGKKAISMNEQDGFQFKFRTQSKSSGCNTNVVGVNNDISGSKLPQDQVPASQSVPRHPCGGRSGSSSSSSSSSSSRSSSSSSSSSSSTSGTSSSSTTGSESSSTDDSEAEEKKSNIVLLEGSKRSKRKLPENGSME